MRHFRFGQIGHDLLRYKKNLFLRHNYFPQKNTTKVVKFVQKIKRGCQKLKMCVLGYHKHRFVNKKYDICLCRFVKMLKNGTAS